MENIQKLKEEIAAATEAQENIDILRNRTASDDSLFRENHSHLEYYQTTQLALKRLFDTDIQQEKQPTMKREEATTKVKDTANKNDILNVISEIK